ncbi:uncharacterized protein [Halyomorpha halys]|uniref:uncharacterized protein isoform X2 n=1 Tax=Halyomorpha halys TaxID=286706 RepID=UPI0034D30F6F
MDSMTMIPNCIEKLFNIVETDKAIYFLYAKNFNLLLFDALMTSKSLGKDNNLRSYVAMDYNINQSACGMFSLDYPLLTSMMASTATYVILLVQLTWLQ